MTIWYTVRRFFGAEPAKFRNYEDAVSWRDKHCPSGSVQGFVEITHPGRPLY